MDMNSCAGSKAAVVDKEMNRLYRKLLEQYKADPTMVARFRSAQRAWLKYRDAQLSTYGREGWDRQNRCARQVIANNSLWNESSG